MKNQSNKVLTMVIAALLSAIGIMIPIISPIQIRMEPASFTLASHVPVIIAMFISPITAAFVALISSLGFFMAGFPIVIVFRALTHMIFASIGAYILKRNSNILRSFKTAIPFVLLIGLIHGVCEVIVSSIFYVTGQPTASYAFLVVGLVGVGSLIHGSIDFIIATLVWIPLQKVITVPVNVRIKPNTMKS